MPYLHSSAIIAQLDFRTVRVIVTDNSLYCDSFGNKQSFYFYSQSSVSEHLPIYSHLSEKKEKQKKPEIPQLMIHDSVRLPSCVSTWLTLTVFHPLALRPSSGHSGLHQMHSSQVRPGRVQPPVAISQNIDVKTLAALTLTLTICHYLVYSLALAWLSVRCEVFVKYLYRLLD